MKNFFNSEDALEIINRVEQFTPENKKQWGKMSHAQMMAHCTKGLQMASGKLPTKRLFIGKLIGGFVKKKYFSEAPLPKGAPTGKELLANTQMDFTVEKQNLVNEIRAFATGGPDNASKDPHPFFGNLTPDEWGLGQYKHLDHHLRQFGG
jgi:hypothetical protein